MATFRVGQRVKLVRHSDLPNGGRPKTPVGSVGTILPHNGNTSFGGVIREYRVKYDGFTLIGLCDGWQLEPLYDGHSKVSWSECLWAPNKETA